MLVAKTDLSRGEVIEPHDIGWQTWPTASANGNFIRKPARPDAINQFSGAIVRVPVAAGQPIFDPMVVIAKGSGFLAAVLPKGMRAVAMDIAADSGAGGFILPEDHVDVLLTHHDKAAEKASGTEKIVTDTILRNVRVLAVDQAVQEKNGQKVVVGKTATRRSHAEAGRDAGDSRISRARCRWRCAASPTRNRPFLRAAPIKTINRYRSTWCASA